MTDAPTIGIAFPREDYLAALTQAGAIIRVLDPTRDVLPDALDALDGVLLTGGPDVAPTHYHAATTHPTVVIDADRDAYELPLARAALATGLPMLAICRGMQVVNVAAGGTLIQDMPSAHAPVHEVSIVGASRLGRLLADRLTPGGSVPVNSRHHQAVETVAPGFVVTATAPDDTIEAMENGHCLAVQWHPENFHRTGEFSALFDALVDDARRHARSKTATHST